MKDQKETQKVYGYIEVPKEIETLREAESWWVRNTVSRLKISLDPKIGLYQFEGE